MGRYKNKVDCWLSICSSYFQHFIFQQMRYIILTRSCSSFASAHRIAPLGKEGDYYSLLCLQTSCKLPVLRGIFLGVWIVWEMREKRYLRSVHDRVVEIGTIREFSIWFLCLLDNSVRGSFKSFWWSLNEESLWALRLNRLMLLPPWSFNRSVIASKFNPSAHKLFSPRAHDH